MKIGVLGSRGMLGTDVCSNLAIKEECEVYGVGLPEFDIRDYRRLAEFVDMVDIVVNCAAYTDVEGAEKNKELCYEVNAYAVKNLAELCWRKRKYLLHPSTDFVFGDLKMEPLKEDDEVCPLNVYGESKLSAEKHIIESGCRYAIIRLEWTYGKWGNNFIKKILQKGQKERVVKVVNDQFGSPTWTKDVAQVMYLVIKEGLEGLYHYASRGYASRYEVAKFAIERAGLHTEILPCSSEEFFSLVKRPKNSRFDCSKIENALSFQRRSWEEALAEFIFELKGSF